MENNSLNYISQSEADTLFLGEKIGEQVHPGQIILITGELGAGKTRLVQGIGMGLGIDRSEITSPTYNLINEYPGKFSLYHMDLYRLDHEEELDDLGLDEYLEGEGITVIEWPKLAFSLIPPDFILIKFQINEDKSRKIEFEAVGERGRKLMGGLFEYVNFRG